MEDDDNQIVMDNNYKGIFYNEDEPEERYFEHGAHFKFKDLCRRLEMLKQSFTGSRREEHMVDKKRGKSIESQNSRNNNHLMVNDAFLSHDTINKMAPHSHININLNNIYINNDNSKSRNNPRSRNVAPPNPGAHSLQLQLNQALKGLNMVSSYQNQHKEEKKEEKKKDATIRINNNKGNIYEGINNQGKKVEIKINKNPNDRSNTAKRLSTSIKSISKRLNKTSHIEAVENMTQDEFNKSVKQNASKPKIATSTKNNYSRNIVSNISAKETLNTIAKDKTTYSKINLNNLMKNAKAVTA